VLVLVRRRNLEVPLIAEECKVQCEGQNPIKEGAGLSCESSQCRSLRFASRGLHILTLNSTLKSGELLVCNEMGWSTERYCIELQKNLTGTNIGTKIGRKALLDCFRTNGQDKEQWISSR